MSFTDPPPPPPPLSANIQWGGSAGVHPAGCSADTTCTYINMTVSGFGACSGCANVSWYDDSPDNGVWRTETDSIDSNGNVSGSRWFGYGGHHYHVHAIIQVNGVGSATSNTLDSFGNPKTGG
jgi:hypothetical protein